MKPFKELFEDTAPVDGEDFSNEMSNPETLNRINAFIGSMGDKEYLVPAHALKALQEKLGRLGLCFDANNASFTEDTGDMTFPLKQFGGRFGKDVDTPHDEVINDDGIEHKTGKKMSLNINYEKVSNNTWVVRGSIA